MKVVLNMVHLPRPDWYEELYAVAMAASMKSYEDELSIDWSCSWFINSGKRCSWSCSWLPEQFSYRNGFLD
ncbi:hypothetical protein HanHA300_Chr04g0152651 [Helianthus annuus]|nr:hypothetical protein HanHA300_Chr04g0152651 [Helianthus annuus]KAJ0598461.1 hypothetical protein HanHA89_Chr04g0166081 [Helianthus annuus]KAJ0759059.1 hypothetical protein HanLR1_Chr04g0157331 [Helianthus annuus]KAJ0762712.1 hypothetical protein HanOQP8_Chr04g0164391 [Helianthus annuus]